MPMHKIVYLGRRELKGGKLGVGVILLSEIEKFEKWDEYAAQLNYPVSYFQPSTKGRFIVGGIYEWNVELDDEGNRVTTVIFSTKGFQGKISNREMVTVLDTVDEAAYVQYKANKKLAVLANESQLENQLKQLKQLKAIYKQIGYTERTAFKVMILNYLERE